METESRGERAAVSALNAVDDLNAAIWLATSPEEVRTIRARIEEVIAQLIISSSVALTLAEHFEGPR